MNEKQSLLDEDTATSDDDVNVKKKESSVSFRQLVRIVSIHAFVIVFYNFSFVMLIKLIVLYYSLVYALLCYRAYP